MEKSARIKGVIPPMVTVFKDDETIDEERTRKHARFLVENGMHGVVVGGSTGEFIALSMEERKRLAEMVVDEVGNKGLVVVGTAHYSTKKTIELSQHAEKIGSDGVLVITPYYLSPPRDDVLNHFRRLAEKVNIPVVLYNNPWFAGYELTSWELKKLADEGVIAAVKAAHGDVDRIHDLKYLCGNKIAVLYGHDYNALEALLVGADGWMSAGPQVVPKLARNLYNAAVEKQDIAKAKEIWQQILPLIHFLHYNKVEGRPHWLAVLKEASNILGRDVGKPMSPVTSLKRENRDKLERILHDVGLLDHN